MHAHFFSRLRSCHLSQLPAVRNRVRMCSDLHPSMTNHISETELLDSDIQSIPSRSVPVPSHVSSSEGNTISDTGPAQEAEGRKPRRNRKQSDGTAENLPPLPAKSRPAKPKSPKSPSLVPASPAVFVSEHFQMARGEVEAFLDRHKVVYKRSGSHLVIETCPLCHPTKGKSENLNKLYVLASSGVYFCHRCRAKGSWFSLRQHIGGLNFGIIDQGEPVETFAGTVGNPSRNQPAVDTDDLCSSRGSSKIKKNPCPAPSPSAVKDMQKSLCTTHQVVRDYIVRERGISQDVLTKYGVGASWFPFFQEDGTAAVHRCFVFPMYDAKLRVVRLKVRSIDDKKCMKLDPKGGSWGIFGLNTVPEGADEVILTEGEFDAMAAFQGTGIPAISLPNGASSLPVSLLPMLERFKKIYLWMDDDIPGREGAQQFSKKLGMNRCFLVRIGRTNANCKDANDALRLGFDMSEMIRHASIAPHEAVATFADFRDQVYAELENPLQVQGLRSEFLPRLNSLIKGHRRGELSIYSGHTGVGKTTLLAQLSLDYCMQGVPTLWGSFEVSNVRIIKLLLSQFYARSTGKSPVGLLGEFDEWAEKFEHLPLYFLRYFGSNPVDRVLDAIEYSNYVHDCSHVLLDNLQFLTSGQGRGLDRFEVMDHAVEKLRNFATVNNVHVSLVVHPRKENDDQEIQTASVFGSAKATQEADNLIILQRTSTGPMLDVRKNRFDGTLGTLNLRFNESSRMFEERDAPRRNVRMLAAHSSVKSMKMSSVESVGQQSSSVLATARESSS